MIWRLSFLSAILCFSVAFGQFTNFGKVDTRKDVPVCVEAFSLSNLDSVFNTFTAWHFFGIFLYWFWSTWQWQCSWDWNVATNLFDIWFLTTLDDIHYGQKSYSNLTGAEIDEGRNNYFFILQEEVLSVKTSINNGCSSANCINKAGEIPRLLAMPARWATARPPASTRRTTRPTRTAASPVRWAPTPPAGSTRRWVAPHRPVAPSEANKVQFHKTTSIGVNFGKNASSASITAVLVGFLGSAAVDLHKAAQSVEVTCSWAVWTRRTRDSVKRIFEALRDSVRAARLAQVLDWISSMLLIRMQCLTVVVETEKL